MNLRFPVSGTREPVAIFFLNDYFLLKKNYRQNWEDFWEKFREIIAKIENIFAKIPNANPTKKLKKLHNFQINHSFFWYHCTQHILLSHKIVTAQNRVLIFIYIDKEPPAWGKRISGYKNSEFYSLNICYLYMIN